MILERSSLLGVMRHGKIDLNPFFSSVYFYQHMICATITPFERSLFLIIKSEAQGVQPILAATWVVTQTDKPVCWRMYSLNFNIPSGNSKRFDFTISRDSYNTLFQGIVHKLVIELSNQILGKVGHFFKWLHTFTLEPFPDLICTEFLFSLLQYPFLHGLMCQTMNWGFLISSPYSLLTSD